MGKDPLPEVPENADGSWHAIIERPNDLLRKVPKSGGVDPEAAFRKAEKLVKTMAADYVDKLGLDIQEMRHLAALYRKEPTTDRLDPLFKLIHNMRGQGATFGFPLITEIGRSFCRYVREIPPSKTVRPDVVDHHIQALMVVYEQSIKGKGDTVAQAVVQALGEVVEKELA